MTYCLFTQFENCNIAPYSYTTILDVAENLFQSGHHVFLFYCDGKHLHGCHNNVNHNPKICKHCLITQQILLYKLSKEIEIIPLSNFQSTCCNKYSFSYNNIKEIKQIEFKKVKIGYAALSSYLLISRNLDPLINDDFKFFFDILLLRCCENTEITWKIIDKYKPDYLVCFNGRIIYSRPIIDIAKILHIPFYSYEGTIMHNEMYKTVFFNATPHDIDENTRIIEKMWLSKKTTIENKMAIAQSFFYNRKHSIYAGDKLYVKEQTEGLLPKNWNPSKHNIIILNSSEDEFASLGEEFEKHNLFESQYKGIQYLIDSFKDMPEYHFYLRIHPNLKNVKYQFHTGLYPLFDNISNFFIIAADSNISTYSLIDNCDKVIVFGSTTGPEAVYWGKPTILLSYCIYSKLNICYIPKNKEEIANFVLDKNLPPKDKLGALKYGYFRYNDIEYEQQEHFKHTIRKIDFFNRHFTLTFYHLDLISNIRLLYQQLIAKSIGNHLPFPDLEQLYNNK